MSFWKKWWKKKNKDKKGADEYEDAPLPTETIFADNDLEKRIRARRNNLSVSRSGRYKAKSKERMQLTEELYNQMCLADAEAARNSSANYNNNAVASEDAAGSAGFSHVVTGAVAQQHNVHQASQQPVHWYYQP